MKKLALILALVASPVFADQEPIPCPTIGEAAAAVMKARQLGIPLSELMEVAVTDLTRAMVLMAYDQPRMSSITYQTQMIEDFRIAWELECYSYE